jgi:hypothetical protein
MFSARLLGGVYVSPISGTFITREHDRLYRFSHAIVILTSRIRPRYFEFKIVVHRIRNSKFTRKQVDG